MKKILSIIALSFVFALTASAKDNIVYQQFVNLTKSDLKVDTLLPVFTHVVDLPEHFEDSVYTVKLVYPEFQEMKKEEVTLCYELAARLSPEQMGEDIEFIPKGSGYKLLTGLLQQVVVDRKKGKLEIIFAPIATDGKTCKRLTGFMVRVQSEAVQRSPRSSRSSQSSQIYADHSVLASGRWAKISVKESGIHELTSAVIKKAGFKSLDKVKIYGYGGNLQPEAIKKDYLAKTDDLNEVKSYMVNGRRLFRAEGPVSYTSLTSARTRNPYSNYGYYLITESDEEPLIGDSLQFEQELATVSYNDQYHTLYEVDNYAWYQGGRNLYEDAPIESGKTKNYTFDLSAYPEGTNFTARVVVSAGDWASFDVIMNDEVMDFGDIALIRYDKGGSTTCRFSFKAEGSVNIGIKNTSNNPLRLDFIDIGGDKRKPNTYLATSAFPAAEYVYNIMNQDLHADRDYQMVIIIPTTQKLRSQAERLKAFHEEFDGMKVRVVPADELFNEFSSGTPDANAYRRYLKMLYDRAETEEQMPKYLLLFGAGAFDNRMLSNHWRGADPDNHLLCFESENSFSETQCYVNDGFFTLLDEGEGTRQTTADREDVAVGRLPVTEAEEARVIVDKIIRYAKNETAGSWQNTIVCMGDDGDNNTHMGDANYIASTVEAKNPNFYVRRIMWDTFKRETSSTGNTYPEVTKTVLAQQREGALIMDYSGHGSPDQLSHENAINRKDFETFTNENMSFWIAAACDVTPYDHRADHLGKVALLNAKGGTIGFLSTARSAFPTESRAFVSSFMRALLTKVDGRYPSVGEAQRLAKNRMITGEDGYRGDATTNKLHYSIMGDPAVCLNIPTQTVVIDSINGEYIKDTQKVIKLKAASVARISGHIEKDGAADEGFNGLASITIRDALKQIVCRMNSEDTDNPYIYNDRPSVIYKGNTGVIDGKFNIVFAVPKDIDYSGETGLITAFAVDNKTHITAHGCSENFEASETEEAHADSIGPSIYCYLNSPSFQDGGTVNPTPFFYAEISDKDGINTAGGSIGHDLQLVIDNDKNQTYNLNSNFSFELGSYTKGSTYYSIPALLPGRHTLRFKAWDIQNNSSSTTLTFNVVNGLTPELQDISCTKNPARDSTAFIISHNRQSADITVDIEVMTMAGRPLWRKTSHEASASSGTFILNWDLTTDSGAKLQTGVYLYRVRISSDGSDTVSKAKKLIVIN